MQDEWKHVGSRTQTRDTKPFLPLSPGARHLIETTVNVSLAAISDIALADPKSSVGRPSKLPNIPFPQGSSGPSNASMRASDASVEEPCSSTLVIGQYTY